MCVTLLPRILQGGRQNRRAAAALSQISADQAAFLPAASARSCPGCKLCHLLCKCYSLLTIDTAILLQVARFLLYDHIKAGTILMKQGDKGDHMYIILSGQANVHIANNTSFKNVVHAIQHTRMLAKLASGSRARMEADVVQSQPSLSTQGSSSDLARSASQQAIGEVMLTC